MIVGHYKEGIFSAHQLVKYNGRIYQLVLTKDMSDDTKEYLKKRFCTRNLLNIKREFYLQLDIIRHTLSAYKEFETSLPFNPTWTPLNELLIYTDGSFKDGKAGSGVYFGQGSKEIIGRPPGLQSNNAGEIYAIILAILAVPIHIPLRIITDSQLVLKISTPTFKAYRNRKSNLATLQKLLLLKKRIKISTNQNYTPHPKTPTQRPSPKRTLRCVHSL